MSRFFVWGMNNFWIFNIDAWGEKLGKTEKIQNGWCWNEIWVKMKRKGLNIQPRVISIPRVWFIARKWVWCSLMMKAWGHISSPFSPSSILSWDLLSYGEWMSLKNELSVNIHSLRLDCSPKGFLSMECRDQHQNDFSSPSFPLWWMKKLLARL